MEVSVCGPAAASTGRTSSAGSGACAPRPPTTAADIRAAERIAELAERAELLGPVLDHERRLSARMAKSPFT
jgi:hypothetical protein